MEGIYKNKKCTKKKINERYNINESSPERFYKSYDNISNKNIANQNFSSFNTSKNKNFSFNSKKNKMLHKNQTLENSLCCPCKSQCRICLCPCIYHCNLHHIHFHTIQIPHHHICTSFNNSIINRKSGTKKLSHDLLNKVSDLKLNFK